ncbi:MAG: 7TM diverse intracellular signaling domain-containing protein [Alcanivoracaceae bacterium]|jgi:signal transduction histidine kinase/CheY-like chemotaxis protein|nr:7TM diverse intracellular signaling domain-containing protein [Alcanivoracaceae bacterium]
MSACRWLLLLFTCWGMPLLAAVEAGPSLGHEVLARHADYWCDGSGESTLEDALRAELTPLGAKQIAFSYRDDACWFHFRLRNSARVDHEALLSVDYALLDHVDLYRIDGEQLRHWQLGDMASSSDRPLALRNATVPLLLPAQSESAYWLRVKSTSSMSVPLTIASRDAFIEHHVNNDWLLGVFYGVGFGLFCYHLVLWVAARERIYRFYVVHVGASLVYLATLQGISQRLWPEGHIFPDNFPYVCGYISLISGALFARDFLETAKWSRLDLLLKGLVAALTVMMVLQIILPPGSVTRYMGMMVLLTMAILMITGFYSWYRGRGQARIFVVAWGTFLGMTGLLAFNIYGWVIELPILLTLHGVHIGIVLQQVLLSLGLAARLSELKKESLMHEQAIVRAQAESAAKGDFLARMSHEIRTPMNAVLALTELLSTTRLDERQKKYVTTINSAGESLLGVINDVLDYSKISAGKLQLEQRSMNLHQVLEDCLTIMSASAEQKGVHMYGDFENTLPEWVSGDPVRIKQVLLNLLSNAVKFTERGTIVLRVSTELRSEKQVRLKFEVHDTGIGMAREQVRDLFRSFQQADSSTSRKYGGTGLGLAISKQLVELMGSVIEVDSRPGEGSRFHFAVWMPLGEPPASDGDNAPISLRGLRVLVVEDNTVNQMVIGALLNELQVAARIVGSGEEALAVLDEDPDCCDLILMDCEMPGMDGYETTGRIRQLKNGSQALPIIALTAHALAEHREKCLAAGMDDHLAKPLTLSSLQLALGRWKDGKRSA